jgi:hypothetical protein
MEIEQVLPDQVIPAPEEPVSLRETLANALKDAKEPQEETVRAPDGKFAKKEPEVVPQVEAAPEVPKVRPSTWKKEYWEHYDKLDPTLQQYIVQRENEYKTGVSTYKQAADEAKGIQDAIAPFLPELQQYKIDPRQWIQNLGNAHRVLALGTQEQKQAKLQELIQGYGIQMPGQADPNPQLQGLYQTVQQLQGAITSIQTQKEQAESAAAQQEISKFETDKENFPYFEQVKGRMAEFLRAGLAPDLKAAYKMAVRTDDSLFEQVQQAQSAQALQEKQMKAAAVAKEAKAKVVSVKGGSPTTPSTTAPTGLRDVIKAQFENARSRI